MASPKKKLRFFIRQIEFTDAQKHFEALPGTHTEYALDMSRTAFRNIAVETVHNDCIAFSQLLRMKGLSYRDLKLVESDEGNGKAYGELKEDFVVVSFARTSWDSVIRIPPHSREDGDKTRAVTQKIEDMAEWLFLHGFKIQNEKIGKTVRYVRFSGSANMSRNGKVMFVNADYEPELSRRVTLGLENDGCLEWAEGLIPSKWDAYKGLCLSDGYALAWLKETSGTPGAPELSEAGVVFIKDMEWKSLSVPASSCDVKPLCFDVKNAGDKKENRDFVTVDFKTGDYADEEIEKLREKACLTDGVGMIAPAAARWISAALCGKPDTISTFQIRLPFVKGMLHAVDFPAYLAERGVTEISDAWGNRRPVSSVWMVLPLSMFKAHKWFKQQVERAADVPRLYHEKLREYGHDLVITQRHMPKAQNGHSEPFRLNYEVLQTCGLNEAEFQTLLRENLKQYVMLRKNRETRFEWLTGGADSPENVEDTDEENMTVDDLLEAGEADSSAAASDSNEEDEEIPETANTDDVAAILAKAVRKNPALLDSKKAKNILTDACNALAFRKLLRGNLTLPKGSRGESRYLVCDLGRYLDYLVSLGGGAKRADCFRPLSPGEFYAPGFPAKGEYCALFRTPHYSRNEHLILRPLPKDGDPARERWFGHLRGALMIPAEGFAAARLGGADFDGDHVSVVDDTIYVGALERVLGLSGLDAAARDLSGGSGLPFIVIPDASAGKGTAFYNWDSTQSPDDNRCGLVKKEFRAFRISCENRVGLFSNYAFTHGAEPVGDKERLVQRLAALCGMEIDAAKTGKKPEFPKDAKTESGLFLSLASKSKRAKKPTWDGTAKGKNELSLVEAMSSFETKNTKTAKPSPCLLDSIPGQLYNAYKTPEDFLDAGSETAQERGFHFSDCFRFPADGQEWGGDSQKLLDDLYDAYLRANYRLIRRRKRKPVSYDNDLIRILWPRFLESGDNVAFNEVHKLCKQFFSDLNGEQKAKIRDALEAVVPFERTRENRETRLIDSFRKATDFDPEQEQGWNKLREQLLNFDRNGFCLPYLMLNLASQEQKKAVNPYYEELKPCKDKETLLEKTRKMARDLCGKAFPDKGSDAVAVLLAARLAKYADASSGKEAFFWMIVGEKDAVSFLRDASGER